MGRSRHPKKGVEAALAHAESQGWRVEERHGRGHAWGPLYCPYQDHECRCGVFCRASVWSTPRSPDQHARQIRKVVDLCTMHRKDPPWSTRSH